MSLAGPGNVTVRFSDGKWKIVGDSEPNSVVIRSLANGNLRIRGGGSDGGVTTINGRSYIDIAPSQNILIQMGNGNDRVSIAGNGSGSPLALGDNLNIEMGDGVDVVICEYLRVAKMCSVSMGLGQLASHSETASFYGISAGSFSYRSDRNYGGNSLGLTASAIRGNVTIVAGDAQNSVNLSSCTISGDVIARMGNEQSGSATADNFSMTADTIGGTVRINMGNGRGIASIGNTRALRMEITFGSAYDQLLVNNVQASSALFDGGLGSQDRISGAGNIFTVSPTILSFENRTLRWSNR